MASGPQVGVLLREWRRRRRLSQLQLACDADISTRHLSFVENGHSQPSREMLLHLAEQLAVPLRERNRLLEAAGYAPVYPERPLSSPPLEAARQAIDLVLKGHEPYPALAIDRYWTLVGHNRSVTPFLMGVDPALRQPPINLLRFTLHPGGLAPRIVNLGEWRAHLLARLHRDIELTGDPRLVELMTEVRAYPAPAVAAVRDYGGVVVPMELITGGVTLLFFSTTTVFGTAVDVTLAELAIEAFFPADARTAEILRGMTS
jgi:transcriptional regulator with XRE-family HTH domain